MTVDFLPVSAQTRQIFDMLSNGTAFDQSSVAHATTMGQHVTQLSTMFGQFTSAPDISAFAPQLTTSGGVIDNLKTHLQNHFANLPQNLALATSHISDMLGAGLGSFSNPCSPINSFFGSIMGGANNHVGQSMNPVSSMTGQLGAFVGAGALQSILNNANMAALSSVPNIGNIASLIANAHVSGNLAQIGALLKNIGAVANLSDLGAFGSQIGSLQNLVNMGNVLSNMANGAGGFGNLQGILSNVSGALGSLGGMLSQFNGILSAVGIPNIGSMIGTLAGGVTTAIQGALTQAMGALQGVMGNVTGMISGELAALGKATSDLIKLAGAINLPQLFNNACGKGVLNAVASTGLKAALTGVVSAGSTDSGTSTPHVPIPTSLPVGDYGQTNTTGQSYLGPAPRGDT